jgi:D-methionine transport system substrate-binding protein
MKKIALVFIASIFLLVTACGAKDTSTKAVDTSATAAANSTAPAAGKKEDKVIKFIASDAGFNAEIIPIIKEEVEKQGFTFDWVIVNDIIQPNKMLDDGTVDANSFQHEAYFDQFVKDHNLKNVVRGFYTNFTPSALYSKKYKTLAEVPDGATFGIPVDPANNGRSLFMLRDKGLLKLKDGVEVVHAGVKDITDNPHKYKFKEVDQLMLQRTLDDVDVGFLFAGTAIKIGLNPKKDSLAYEDGTSLPYKGIVAIRKDLVGSPKAIALQNAYKSEKLKAFYTKQYGDSIVFLDDLNK